MLLGHTFSELVISRQTALTKKTPLNTYIIVV